MNHGKHICDLDEAKRVDYMPMANYVFLVHPRSLEDIYRKYPDFRNLPEPFLEELMFDWPCVPLSEMNGIKSGDGNPVSGLLMSVSFTPSMMLKRPGLFKDRIAEAICEARKTGAKVIGLGGLIPSFTRYGISLKKFAGGVALTTGHSYTAYTIGCLVERTLAEKRISGHAPGVAILGAAGSTGSLALETLIDRGLHVNYLLVDMGRKLHQLESTARHYKEKDDFSIETSAELSSLNQADVIVVVTNANEVILRPEHIKDGAVIIDDTHPRNTSKRLLEKAMVIDVLSELPGLKHDFDLGLIGDRPEITFSCLAETAILAACGWKRDFSIGKPDISRVKEIAEMADRLGARPASTVSFGRLL